MTEIYQVVSGFALDLRGRYARTLDFKGFSSCRKKRRRLLVDMPRVAHRDFLCRNDTTKKHYRNLRGIAFHSARRSRGRSRESRNREKNHVEDVHFKTVFAVAGKHSISAFDAMSAACASRAPSVAMKVARASRAPLFSTGASPRKSGNSSSRPMTRDRPAASRRRAR